MVSSIQNITHFNWEKKQQHLPQEDLDTVVEHRQQVKEIKDRAFSQYSGFHHLYDNREVDPDRCCQVDTLIEWGRRDVEGKEKGWGK